MEFPVEGPVEGPFEGPVDPPVGPGPGLAAAVVVEVAKVMGLHMPWTKSSWLGEAAGEVSGSGSGEVPGHGRHRETVEF